MAADETVFHARVCDGPVHFPFYTADIGNDAAGFADVPQKRQISDIIFDRGTQKNVVAFAKGGIFFCADPVDDAFV